MPTGYAPIYRIRKDGNDITANFNDRTTSIRVDLFAGGGNGDTAVITLDDRNWRIARPHTGDRLEIDLGYKEVGLAYMGNFEVDEVTFSFAPKTISLRCTSTGMRSLIKAPAIKDYSNKTLGDIVGDIAKSAGVPALIEESLKGIKIPFLNTTESPMHLLHDLERRFGAVAKINGGKLICLPRDLGVDPDGSTVPIVVLRPEHFRSGRVRHTERGSYGNVKASYRGETGVRKWTETPRIGEGGADLPEFKIGRLFNSKQEAEAAGKAQAALFASNAGDATMSMSKGDPWLRDQQRVMLAGFRDGINGSYVLNSVCHVYSPGGLLTDFQAGPDGTGSDYGKLYEEAPAGFLDLHGGVLLGEFLKGPQRDRGREVQNSTVP